MGKMKALELKKGDVLVIGGEELVITELELSDMGKQGTKKVRVVAKKKNGENVTLIRPIDYPLEVK